MHPRDNFAPFFSGSARNLALYPWFKFFQSLLFWQAVWFLFFQGRLSAAEAVLIYAFYDIATTVLEVPSGFLSDKVGRRITLLISGAAMFIAAMMQVVGESFTVFALAQVFLGAGMAFASGTDSALLYESLMDEGRGDEIEVQELRAWRFVFAGLALAAVSGGAASLLWDRLPFLLTAIALALALLLTFRMSEPERKSDAVPQGDEVLHLASLKDALVHPLLLWLFALTVLMYGFSHVPFIFGQPFILQALEARGLQGSAPLVSGIVTTIMMGVSLLASLVAARLRARIGLPAILLLAFAIQIVLVGVLAASASLLAIAFLFLRMVPDSLSRPFIMARIQPLLRSDARATYLSLKSLVARLLFAGSLFLASGAASDSGSMVHAEIRQILLWYIVVGVLAFGALAVTARRIPVEAGPEAGR